jgi:hypothetical protein
LERAAKSAEETAELCNKLRKSSFFGNVAKMIKKPNYNKYTDSEYNIIWICTSTTNNKRITAAQKFLYKFFFV